jgi:hypothetical protein
MTVIMISLTLYNLIDVAKNHAKDDMHDAAIDVLEYGLDKNVNITKDTERGGPVCLDS